MSLSHSRLFINGTTPTKVTPDEWLSYGPKTNCTIQIQNLGEDYVYIGGEGLTDISYGCSIAPAATLVIDDLPPYDEVYALSSGASGYVGVLQVVR